ncbi:ubiquinol-cytochrome c reductase iron-sulfur subunit [Aestuariirhabdus sp. Z084]|uniref:ubiquinol-cytochrome c reductase iron-sulfur subunit n=1 Tax=Aestuariirhabdus haliotis TaxID=2918751 RepID=UPI00201B3C85|nr:ubiquinol-cytochrome c reductase iron-sulfur subunit [Aestuariirhabdus haliotis]MCL6415930.1 ubiquinol-cytochrome c reductase iron-sulfur subunit [Aestuariirhabdus haliotis]MCL6419928.1 ubiquinol-cytochrome c reductase iron-sulfur subunit [Aestuariirhabdus haliotis]
MSNDGVDKGRRRLLIGATSAVGAVGAVGAAVPFVASWNPSAKAKAAGAPVRVKIDKLEMGQQVVAAWRGKPVFVLRREQVMLDNLPKQDGNLRDPQSNESEQPDYAKNEHRSRNSELLVLVGLCTHLGCSPKLHSEVKPMDFEANWQGGYHCPCHGSKFDLAGRVYQGVPAPTNLTVPPYSYLDDNTIIIGVDEENA